MRYIGIEDSNNNKIYEGDTLEFSSKNIYLEEELIEFLDVDKVLVNVIPQEQKTGSQLEYHFYSNEKEVLTYKNKYDYLKNRYKEENKTLIEIEEWFQELSSDNSFNPHSVIETIVSQKDNSIDYHHEFIHKDKVIVKSVKEEDKTEERKNELLLSYGENVFPVNSEFLVELTPEAKERCIYLHELLNEKELPYEGDFDYIKLITNELTLNSHSFKCIPLDNNLQMNWYSVFESRELMYKEMDRILNPIREATDKWINENQKSLKKEDFERLLSEKKVEYKKELNSIKGRSFKEKKLNETIFLGLSPSDNLLTYFYEVGCNITIINNRG